MDKQHLKTSANFISAQNTYLEDMLPKTYRVRVFISLNMNLQTSVPSLYHVALDIRNLSKKYLGTDYYVKKSFFGHKVRLNPKIMRSKY
jgi:hypothetical protein